MIKNNIYTTTPNNVEGTASLGLFAYQTDVGLPGITSLTFKHSISEQGFDLERCDDLVTLNFPNLVSISQSAYFYFSNGASIQSINFPKLQYAYDFEVVQSSLPTLSLPLLQNVDGYFSIYGNSSLTSFNAPSLISVSGNSFVFQINTSLTTVNFDSLELINSYTIFSNNGFVALSFPSLHTIANQFFVQNNSNLQSIQMTALTQSSTNFTIDSNSSLIDIQMGVLVTVGDAFQIINNSILETLILPSLTNIGISFYAYNNPLLSVLSIPNVIIPNGGFFTVAGCALDIASVARILASAVSNGSLTSGTIDISGGTNAAPTGSALDDYNTLIGRGVTVNINEPPPPPFVPHINVNEDAATIDFELDPSWHVFPIIDGNPVDSGSANDITVPIVGAAEYLVAATSDDAAAYWSGGSIVESVLDIYLNNQGDSISSTNFSIDWVLHENPFVGPQLIATGKIYGDDSNPFSGGLAPLTGTPFELTTGSMVFSGSTFSVNFTASVGNLDIFETTTNNYIYPVATDVGAIHITGSPEFFGLYLPSLANTSGGLAQCESDENFHTLYVPQITSSGGFTIWFNDSLTSLDLPGLTSVGGIDLLQCNAVTEVLMPNLVTVYGGDYSLNTNDNIQTVDIHSLRTIQGSLNIGPNPSLTSIDISSLESTGEGSSFIVFGSPLLTTFDISSLTQIGGTFGGNFSVQGCGLDETTINAILAKLVAINFGVGFGFSPIVDLSQGTNASPTGQGLTDKQTLTDRGVTVTINPP